ncbi:MAG: hypothetical protein ABL890_02250 [Candidatus Peribacteraceae bacterium]
MNANLSCRQTVVLAVLCLSFASCAHSTDPEESGLRIPRSGSALLSSVEAYATQQYREQEASGRSACSGILYGYDDQYVHTWMLCENFSDTTVISAYSSPVRFTRSKEGIIIGMERPKDGVFFQESVESLFPASIVTHLQPSNIEIDRLEKRNRVNR